MLLSVSGIIPSISSAENRPVWLRSLSAVCAFVVFSFVQWPFLRMSGQTIGKKVMNIRIVNLAGQPPSLVDLIFRRYAFFFLIAAIPLIGSLISLVSILMIFGRNRRCLHDIVGGTKVISIESVSQHSERQEIAATSARDHSNDAAIVEAIFRRRLSLDWNEVDKDADLERDLRIPRGDMNEFFAAVAEALELNETDQLERCSTPREISACLNLM